MVDDNDLEQEMVLELVEHMLVVLDKVDCKLELVVDIVQELR